MTFKCLQISPVQVQSGYPVIMVHKRHLLLVYGFLFIYFFLSGLSRWNFFFVFFQLLEIINYFSTLTGRFSELLYTYV